ncbi:hypothetical protein BDZ89DRAFT_1137254 [Hymenopellis radicata]|nr:hypothetical protein BDZ89DRAFT_1137254 [Hymenopellis radicata]
MVNLKNVSYDDRDFTDLKYTGTSWFTDGSWNASNVGRTGTLSTARDVDATVTFTFPQPANAFYYYGIPQCCGGNYSICVNCHPDAPQFKIIDAVNRSDDGRNLPVILFSYTFEDFGIHEVILKNNNDTRFNESQITVDQFVLQVEDSDAVSSSSSSATSSVSQTAAAVADATTPSKSPLGLIVGATLGVPALLAFLVAVFMAWQGRRRRAAKRERPAPATGPFLLASATTASPSKHSRSTVLAPTETVPDSSGSTSAAPPRPSRSRETDAGPV